MLYTRCIFRIVIRIVQNISYTTTISKTTRNTNSTMDNGGKQVSMRLVKGPFSRLEGNWIFHPVGDGTQRACKVELELAYGFDSTALAALIGPIFDRIANSMVDAFIQRAEKVYG